MPSIFFVYFRFLSIRAQITAPAEGAALAAPKLGMCMADPLKMNAPAPDRWDHDISKARGCL
jgi:hypothetical protein